MTSIKVKPDHISPRPIAKLVITCDEDAERYMVIDRKTGSTIISRYIPQKGVPIMLALNPSLANTPELMVVIIDDNKEFAAVLIDGVSAPLGDANDGSFS